MAKAESKATGRNRKPPFETDELRKSLNAFFQLPYTYGDPKDRQNIGSYKWGVYLFYDYDREPIYVGQTREQVSQRISRHLTNQRTDAVAMSVLDPFEVFEIEVWPLPQFQDMRSKNPDFNNAKEYLNALEFRVHQKAILESSFKAILNEKDPPTPTIKIDLPPSIRGKVVSEKVYELRSHVDARIARRSQVISRLAQTISERQVQGGLRRTLFTQARRLSWLAERRYGDLGGDAIVEKAPESDGEESNEQ